MNSIETELGLMQAELDAERQAQKFLADWLRNYKGRLAEPKPQPQAPQAPPSVPPQVNYG